MIKPSVTPVTACPGLPGLALWPLSTWSTSSQLTRTVVLQFLVVIALPVLSLLGLAAGALSVSVILICY